MFQLARAGFFFRPAPDSIDNVQCFLCGVKLDGWDPDDDALREHLAHSPACAWALVLFAPLSSSDGSAAAAAAAGEEWQCDPLSDSLVAARTATFASLWPHAGKRGWRCTVARMVRAGWAYDPSPDGGEDGATCFYCNLSLDGWEPKDDPEEEHQRRSPECRFFALRELFHGRKGKGEKKKGGRGSVMSARASGGSFMSAATATEEVEVGDDDSLMSTVSTATVTGKKKGGRKAATAKSAKGRKRANTVEGDAAAAPYLAVVYPDLTNQSQPHELLTSCSQPLVVTEPAQTRAARKGGASQPSKQIDTNIEVSTIDIFLPKKAARGRKAAKQAPVSKEPRLKTPPTDEQNMSDASAQLQEELEQSLSQIVAPPASHEREEATPQPPPLAATKGKRGVKRSSDGTRKADVEEEKSILDEFPAPPKPAAVKGKRGRTASKPMPSVELSEVPVIKDGCLVVAEEAENYPTAPQEALQAETAATTATTTTATATAPKKRAASAVKAKKPSSTGFKKGRGGGRKASSTRSSKDIITTASEAEEDGREDEDLARDEAEIEAELTRIAAEQEKGEEWEGSPSSGLVRPEEKVMNRKENKMRELEAEVHAEDEGHGKLAPVAATPSPPRGSEDKENDASSALQIPMPSGSKLPTAAEQPLLPASPTERVPLAPIGTPNLHPASYSPSKQDIHLTTVVPWIPADLDSILLASPPTSPSKLATRLGVLTSPEKGMRVEEWVRWRAARAEEDLRRRCEGLVARFEGEGMRALSVLAGGRVEG